MVKQTQNNSSLTAVSGSSSRPIMKNFTLNLTQFIGEVKNGSFNFCWMTVLELRFLSQILWFISSFVKLSAHLSGIFLMFSESSQGSWRNWTFVWGTHGVLTFRLLLSLGFIPHFGRPPHCSSIHKVG